MTLSLNLGGSVVSWLGSVIEKNPIVMTRDEKSCHVTKSQSNSLLVGISQPLELGLVTVVAQSIE
jgi:hypothetical protein